MLEEGISISQGVGTELELGGNREKINIGNILLPSLDKVLHSSWVLNLCFCIQSRKNALKEGLSSGLMRKLLEVSLVHVERKGEMGRVGLD